MEFQNWYLIGFITLAVFEGLLIVVLLIRHHRRQRVKVALQKYADEISDLYNNAPCGYHSLDKDGVFIRVNDTELRWLGLEREQVIGKLRFTDLLPADSMEVFRKHYPRFKEQGAVADVEFRLACKGGALRWMLLSATAVRDAAGKFLMSRSTLYDITERKQAEEQVNLLQTITMKVAAADDLASALEILLRCVCENTGWVFGQAWLPRPDGTALDCGPAWFSQADLEVFRSASKQTTFPSGVGLPGRVWRSKQPAWIEDATLDTNFPRAQVARAAGIKTALATPILLGDEVVAVIEFFLCEPQCDDPRFTRVIAAVAAQLGQIIARKRAESALRESENRWRTIFDEALIGIALLDEEGRPVQSNPALQRMLGYSADELRRMPCVEFTYPEDATKDDLLYEELIEGQREHYQMEKRYLRKDGRVVWGHLIVSILRDQCGEGQLLVGMLEDITERKRAEDQLRATSEQLRALMASLRRAREEEGVRIAREIHDELGSALTSLRWDLEVVDKQLAESTARSALREKIEAMMRLIDATVNIVRRIASELRPSVLDDLGLVSAIEWQAQQFEARTGIHCRCHCPPDEIELSAEQATALFRIFQEALTNVLRHAQATRIDIHMHMATPDGEYVLTISDNGRGISEGEKLGHASLGLLGMRERAHLIGGEVEVSGDSGKGTTVTVRVPVAAPARP